MGTPGKGTSSQPCTGTGLPLAGHRNRALLLTRTSALRPRAGLRHLLPAHTWASTGRGRTAAWLPPLEKDSVHLPLETSSLLRAAAPDARVPRKGPEGPAGDLRPSVRKRRTGPHFRGAAQPTSPKGPSPVAERGGGPQGVHRSESVSDSPSAM